MRVEQRIAGDVPVRYARASVAAYSLRTPVYVRTVIAVVVVGGCLGLATESWVSGVVAAVVLAVVVVLQVVLSVGKLARALPARGYRPGGTLTLDWQPESFTFTTTRGSATYRHDEIGWRRVRGPVTVLFVPEANQVMPVPTAMLDAVTSDGGATVRN